MEVRSRATLVPLFLVSLSAVGYETALTRYFAVAKWSEYGYWVISIVMVGFALSGVVLALLRDAFARHGAFGAGGAAGAAGACRLRWGFITPRPTRSIRCNCRIRRPGRRSCGTSPATMPCLLPFFFLAGLFVSLSFVLNAERIGVVYGYDLTGAGAGAALVLAAMFLLHAFFLVPLLLVPLAASACSSRGGGAGWRQGPRWLRCSAARRCCCSTARPRSTTSRRSMRRCTRPTRGCWPACCRRAATICC